MFLLLMFLPIIITDLSKKVKNIYIFDKRRCDFEGILVENDQLAIKFRYITTEIIRKMRKNSIVMK